MRDEPTGGIRSVERAMAILRAFGHREPELGVTELSRRLDLHKSTVSRLLGTMEQGGLVERNPDTGRYRLGLELLALAGQVARHGDLRSLARPHLEILAAGAGETANLAVLHQGVALNVEQFVPGDRQIRDIGWVGRRTPLHATSTGKVLLAYLPVDERTALLANLSYVRYTERTITDPGCLVAELAAVAAQGFAIGAEELELGLNSVAAPVRDRSGLVTAAVSVSGPAYRVTPERLPALTRQVLVAAERISTATGWTPTGRS
jgi:DNA-binding IclR family transcriptional regulator